MDVKYLNDIPAYLPQMRLRGLPEYQYTIRDVRTGLLFLAFADQISKSHACACVRRFLRHLGSHQVKLPEVTIQTDNGSEFDGQLSATEERGFIHAIERLGAGHRFIPVGCSNANADVETSHALIEPELYERERFGGAGDFLSKSWTYQCHFNFTRKNSYQGWHTPLERLREAAPEISVQVALLPPVFLDTLLPSAPKRRRKSLREEILQNLVDPSARTPPKVWRTTPPGGQHQPGHPENPTVCTVCRWPGCRLPQKGPPAAPGRAPPHCSGTKGAIRGIHRSAGQNGGQAGLQRGTGGKAPGQTGCPGVCSLSTGRDPVRAVLDLDAQGGQPGADRIGKIVLPGGAQV